ncbi:hypothetical protein [Frigoriglobus tundricola]|uniref:Uncharacterized protein n=1 Tax=Frigoriglobus tundricola TaxID=2774151 RepID=A0A6M5Z734_9BACT|nr:hypothetical protein [Frigoriglobus tundricola]QJX01171.1 hypothetical protein FTUN_8810 [Frigoriglobus tundricola]
MTPDVTKDELVARLVTRAMTVFLFDLLDRGFRMDPHAQDKLRDALSEVFGESVREASGAATE